MTTLTAVFDGTVLRPEAPIDLAANTRVRLTIEPTEEAAPVAASFLQTARALDLEGPRDWSANLEDYLYGDVAEPRG
jgi:hypothetical protein